MVSSSRRSLLLGAAALAVSPRRSLAQSVRSHRLGFLTLGSPDTALVPLDAVKEGLRSLGYAEGTNYTIEPRYALGRAEILDGLASDLVRSDVGLILTQTTPAALAAKTATSTLPIVVIASGDLVAAKVVESLARPGGNVTGLSFLGTELAEKQMETIKLMAPHAKHIALLASRTFLPELTFFEQMRRTAPKLDVSVSFVESAIPPDYPSAFREMAALNVDALVVASGNLNNTNWPEIIDIARRAALPAIYPVPEAVRAGGLVSYGINRADFYRRAAEFVDRILRGAKPGDLPIRQPTQFELAVNLRTAKMLGVIVSQSILIQANEIVD